MSTGTFKKREFQLKSGGESPNEETYAAVAASGAGVFELDAETEELFLSPSWYRMLGMNPAASGSARWLEFLSKLSSESRRRISQSRKKAEVSQSPIHCELELGEGRTPERFELRARCLRRAGRLCVCGLLWPIESNKQTRFSPTESAADTTPPAQECERQLIRFQAGVLESFYDSVVAANESGHIVYWGPGAEALYGCCEKEALGKPLSTMIGMEAAESPGWFAEVRGRGHWAGETPLQCQNGDVIWVEAKISRVKDALQHPMGWVCLSSNVSQSKANMLALQRTREQQDLTLSVLRGGYWEWRITTNEASYSSGYCRMLGWGHTAADGKISDWRAAIHPQDRTLVETALNRYFSGQREIYECEYRLWSGSHDCDPDGNSQGASEGQWVSILDRGRLVESEIDGQAERMIGVSVDMSEHQFRANELLLMKQAVAGSLTPIAVCDETGAVSVANDAFRQLWNLDRTDDSNSRANLNQMFSEFAALTLGVKDDGCWSGEGTGRRPDGSTLTLEICAGQVENSDGSSQFVITCLDITQRKTEELALLQSRRQFERMVDSLPQMVWMSGADRKCAYVNRQWLDFTGRTMEEETGHGWNMCLHPDDRSVHIKIYQHAFSQRIPYESRYRLRRHDGEYRWVLDRGMPWVDECGEFAGYIGACIDITDQQQASEQLDKKRDELAFANRVSTIGEMATGLAHELNQPLAALKAYASGCCNILEQHTGELADSIRKPLHNISVQAGRAADIVRSLRALVRRRSPRHSTHDIVELADGIIPLFQMEAAKSLPKVRLSCCHAEDLPPVYCDPVLIQQVLLNLLRNSVDSMSGIAPSKRRIKIKTRLKGDDKITIAVSDSGPGMSDTVRERACNPFFSTKTEGMGMGLAICQSIIEEHGGSLHVGGSRLGGAKMSFSLPTTEH